MYYTPSNLSNPMKGAERNACSLFSCGAVLLSSAYLPGISVWRGAFVYALLHLKHDFSEGISERHLPRSLFEAPGFFRLDSLNLPNL